MYSALSTFINITVFNVLAFQEGKEQLWLYRDLLHYEIYTPLDSESSTTPTSHTFSLKVNHTLSWFPLLLKILCSVKSKENNSLCMIDTMVQKPYY